MRNGFSLVELSIVLVILGLLTGGILAGQNLIRAAEIRKISTEFQKYESAVNTFRDKYFALPGDMRNATDFWTAAANCPGAHNQGSTGTETCDGNGNGLIDYEGSFTAPTLNEHFRFWQHLANAGLLEGQYSGVTASTSNTYVWASGYDNNPTLINQATVSMWSSDSSSSRFDYSYDPYVYVTGVPLPGSWNGGNFLSPEETWNIDTKMDDGQPGRGAILATVSTNCTGTSTGTDYDAEYVLTNSAKDCRIEYRPGF